MLTHLPVVGGGRGTTPPEDSGSMRCLLSVSSWRATPPEPLLADALSGECGLPRCDFPNFCFEGQMKREEKCLAAAFSALRHHTREATVKNLTHLEHATGSGRHDTYIRLVHFHTCFVQWSSLALFFAVPTKPLTKCLMLSGSSAVYWSQLSTLKSNAFKQLLSKGICNCS